MLSFEIYLYILDSVFLKADMQFVNICSQTILIKFN